MDFQFSLVFSGPSGIDGFDGAHGHAHDLRVSPLWSTFLSYDITVLLQIIMNNIFLFTDKQCE